MKKLLLIFCLTILSFLTKAQVKTEWCNTPQPTSKQRAEALQFLESPQFLSNQIATAEVKKIAIKAHVIRQSNGLGGVTQANLLSVIDTLNKQYIGANIQFFLLNNQANYINDDAYVAFNPDTEQTLCAKYDVNNAINIYFVREFTNGIGGYAYFPDTKKNTNRLFVYYANVEDMIKRVVPHELGHYFGLYHTFQDSWDSRLGEFVTRGEGSNCSYTGDMICDTPADPYGKILFFGGVKCDFDYDFTDVNGDKYRAQTGNMMSYYRGCGNFFTSGQHRFMTYGVQKRLTPDVSITDRYTITGEGQSSIVIATDNPVLKQGDSFSVTCTGQSISVPFSVAGNVKTGTEYKVLLMSEKNDIVLEIGKGTQSPIECKLPDNTPYYFQYRVQVIAEDIGIRGTLSSNKFTVAQKPFAYISGTDNIFPNEQTAIKVVYGGGDNIVLKITGTNGYNSTITQTDIYSPLSITINPATTTTYKVESVRNSCGNASPVGEAIVTVTPRPVASSLALATLPDSVCSGQTVQLTAISNGVFQADNVFRIQLSDGDGKNFQDLKITTQNDIISFKIPDNQLVSKNYILKISSKSPALEYTSSKISVVKKGILSITGDKNILNGQAADLEVKSSLAGSFTFKLSNGNSYNASKSPFKVIVNPEEDTQYSIVSGESSCGVTDLVGAAKITVQVPITVSILPIRSICSGQVIDVPFTADNPNGLSSNLVVQLSSDGWKTFINLPTTKNNNSLKATIPAETPTATNYQLRIASPTQQIVSSVSNEFGIKGIAIAKISGLGYGNQSTNVEIPLTLSGTFPMDMTLSDGQKFTFQENTNSIAFKVTQNSVYTIASIKNECGIGLASGRVQVEFRPNTNPYCTPVNRSTTNNYNISRVAMYDYSFGYIMDNFEYRSAGKGGYTLFNDKVVYLQKNGNYYLTANTYQSSGFYFASGYTSPIRAWIDFNQDGNFGSDEIIISKGDFSVGQDFTVPPSARKGITRMRVRCYPYNDANSGNPCMDLSDGETEDYLLNIVDTEADYKALSVNSVNNAQCQGRDVTIYSITKGSFDGNTNDFIYDLVDGNGNLIKELGRTRTNFLTIKIPENLPISNEQYRVRVSAPAYNLINYSSFFRISTTPSIALLDKELTIQKGNYVNLNTEFKGGGGWSWLFNINDGATNRSEYWSFNNPDWDNLKTYTRVGPLDKTTTYEISNPYNTGCGNGPNIVTKVVIKVLDGNLPSIDIPSVNPISCLTSSINSSIITTGKFNIDNYFTYEIVDLSNRLVSNIGYFKKAPSALLIPSGVKAGIYKLKVSSSSPKVEAYSNIFEAFEFTTFTLSGDAEIMSGESATIKLTRTNPGFSSSSFVYLNDGTAILNLKKNEYSFKVAPTTTTTYRIDRASGGCGSTILGSATVKILSPRAEKLLIGKVDDACNENSVSVPISFDGTQSTKNKVSIKLIDADNKYMKDLTGSLLDKNLVVKLPNDLVFNTSYRFQFLSQSPYITAESNLFKIKPKITATLSTITKEAEIYEKSPLEMKIDFTGESPWNVLLSDGTKLDNIKDNPLLINRIADVNKTNFGIQSVNGACGEGTALGSVKYNVVYLPLLSTSLLSDSVVCLGKSIDVPFVVSKGKFRADNNFKIEFQNLRNNAVFSFPVTTTQNPVAVTVPKTIASDKYRIRIVGSNPLTEGTWSPVNLFVRPQPTAKIQGSVETISGDIGELYVTTTGNAPWKITLSDGRQFTTYRPETTIPISPLSTTTYTLQSVSDVCGEGSVSGVASARVYADSELDELVKLAPNPTTDVAEIRISQAMTKYFKEVVIYNSLGQNVYSQVKMNAMDYPLRVQLAIGTYYVKVVTDKGVFYRKLVKY
jgi:GEVED domain/Pregnancy-associated plasma protein-A